MGKKPLEMRPLSPEGPYVPSPMLCSVRRREYFERANQILGFYMTMAAYSNEGKASIERNAKQSNFTDETPIRLTTNEYVMQSNYKHFQNSFKKAGVQLTNQVWLMMYGNFEAFLMDLVHDGLVAQGSNNPLEETIALMMRSKWRGKLDRISQELNIKLGKNLLKRRFKDLEMGFLGEGCTDPIEFLEKMADVRHRIIHSVGRVDAQFAREYPKANLKEGDLIELPFGLPVGVHFFFIMLTEVIDESFCDRFGWPRTQIAPENLVPR